VREGPATDRESGSTEPLLFSVVIPARNAEPSIDAQLNALDRQVDAGPFEVIVVDNLSTDRTVDVARGYAERLDLRVVTASEGHSASHARNVGIDHARGEFIVFVDADDVADSALLSEYRRHAAGRQIMGGRYDETRLNDPRVAAWRYEITNSGLPVAFGKVPFFLMGNVAIHRSVFERIGKFDEALKHGGEEVDFSARALLAGYEIGWVPDAVVYYRHRSTLRGLARQFFDYGRATTYVYARFRHEAELPRTALADGARVFWAVVPHVVDIVRGSKHRGSWVRVTSFYAGQLVESVHQRVLHVG
jgi:glycosyltransferase involved in cell wall biosynthesis